MDISAVVPLYNGERFLAATLEAIVAQTVPAREILVVDDGSSDGGPAIAAGFGERVTLIRAGANGGVQAARNLAISRARGDWIAFCDQDDLWAPGYLARQAALLRAAPGVGFAFTDFRMQRDGVPDGYSKFDQAPPGYWDRAGRRLLTEGWVFEPGALAGPSFLWHPVFPSAAVVSRRLVKAVGGFDTAMRGLRPEDWEFTLRCLYRARVGVVPEPLVTIRRHDANFSRDQMMCLVDEVDLMGFVQRHHPEAASHRDVIEAEKLRRRIQAAELAFAQRNHALARRLLAEVPWRARSPRLLAKSLCVALPDGPGLALNGLLQRLSEARQGGAPPAPGATG